MIPEKLMQVLKHEGVVAIVTTGNDGPHVVNTWNSYLHVTNDAHLLIPVGGMVRTEANVGMDHNILMTLGTREVEGLHGPGTGFLLRGSASFLRSGASFDFVKQRFSWIRAVMEVKVASATQTL